MKKITMASLIAAAIVFGGCSDKSKEAVEETTAKAVETTKEATATVAESATKAVDATKEVAAKAVDSAKETTESATEAVKAAGASISEATDKAAAAAKEAVAEVADKAAGASNEAGAAAYAKCAACHGVDGKTKALNKSEIIAGQSKDDLVAKLKQYKAGTLNVSGMGTLMKGQIAPMSDADIDAVAQYISTLK